MGPPRINAPSPLFDTWERRSWRDKAVQVHPTFDDTPPVPVTTSEIRVMAE